MRSGNCSPFSSSPRRSSAAERVTKISKKALRMKHGDACIAAAAMFGVGILILVLSSSKESSQQSAASTAGRPSKDKTSRGWEIAKHGFFLGGRGVLQAVGLGVVSAEEQKQVMESLLQSGDDDHESEVVENTPPTSKRIVKPEVLKPVVANTPPASTDPKVIERIPLAGFPSLPGELALSDGSCKTHPRHTNAGVVQEDCSAGHGFCYKSACICTLTYSGFTCGSPKRPFAAHLRAIFDGRFALSATHVRRLKSLKYVLPPDPGEKDAAVAQTRAGVFEVPFVRKGKVNRVVWAHLQQGDLPKMQPVLSQALLDLLPGKDPLSSAVFYSCAIVGNSGNNLLFPSGNPIDAHSMVIRLNDGPTRPQPKTLGEVTLSQKAAKDFSASVGTRTTFRMLDSSKELVGWHETKHEILLSPVTNKEHFFEFFQSLNKAPDARSYLLDPEFANYVADNVRGVPSPLAIALFFAVQKCSVVDVYGAHWQPGYGVPEKYYSEMGDEDDRSPTSPHELSLLEAMARAGVVTLAHPCAAGCPAESGVKCSACPPGSACACGKHSPLPVALPGYCHVPGNVTCFFKCPPDVKQACQGGPGASECPEGVDTSASCVTASRVDPPTRTPSWEVAGGMRDFDRKYEMTRRQMRRARKGRRRKARRGRGG